jgi:hypothetical protein
MYLLWGRAAHATRSWAPPAAARRLHNQNYTCYHVPEGSLPKAFEAELEPLDYASKANIKHDIEDIYRLQNGTLGCPLPPQLKGMWGECARPPARSPACLPAVLLLLVVCWACSRVGRVERLLGVMAACPA